MNSQDDYIPPTLEFFPSFEDAFNDDPQKQHMRSFLERFRKDDDVFKSLLHYKRNYVIAEPGYGKTRLLREVVRHAPVFGKEAIFIDLKRVGRENFVEAIKNQAKVYDCKTNNFEFVNDEKIVFCFDALDEIQTENFSEQIEQLKLLVADFNNALFIISCRRHHFKQQFKNLSVGNDFRFARLFSFSMEQVSQYLHGKGFTENEIERIFELLSFQERNMVIQTPRYLELLAAFLKEKKEKEDITLQDVTRTKLFEYFIDKKLEHEDLKLNEQNHDLAKRLLETVALIMEIYQVNILTKDELMSILGDIKSNFPAIFFQQVPIKHLYNNSILKSEPESVEFDNTEFQEYLAAKEIQRLGSSKRVAFDLFVDPILRQIHPSWFNVLRFLLEMNGSLLMSILEYGRGNKDKAVEDEEYHRLLLSVNVESLKPEEKKAIFEHIFIYYQDVEHWLSNDIAHKLAYCFDRSQNDLLKRYLNKEIYKGNETKRFVNCGNVADVIAFIFERKVFIETEKEFWKRRLIEFAKDENTNGVLQRNSLFALTKLMDDSVIQELECVWKSDDETLRNQFLDMCREINPNHELSIKYFVEGLKREDIFGGYAARRGLYEITSSSGIKKLLEHFRSDQKFLKKFIDREGSYKDKDRVIIDNIDAAWDDEIQSLSNAVIINAYTNDRYYWLSDSKFLPEIALLLKKKNKDYIFELISNLQGSIKENGFALIGLFSVLLEVEQVERFVREIEKIDNNRYYALRILQEIKYSKRENAKGIYEEGRQFFQAEYAKAERESSRRENRLSEAEQLYHQFRIRSEPEESKYIPEVFEFYQQHEDTIKHLVQEDELSRLKTLITTTIFENFDPGDQTLKINERDKHGSTQYTTHSWIRVFGSCIILANRLSISIEKYRKRILNYIPFAYDDHLSSIFALIRNVAPEEIQDVLSIYRDRSTSDLWRFMPKSLIRAGERYNIQNAAPILRGFVDENEFSSYDRMRALEVAEFLAPDIEFLRKTFDRYISGDLELKIIALTANSLLIKNHEDEAAIAWRFQELEKRAYPKQKHKNGVFYGSDELREKEFAAPVMQLKNPQREKRFLNLLKTSFALVSKDGYYPYANYLWEIVYAYFYNRKAEGSYKPLETLEKFVAEYSTVEGVNWFKYHLKKLKREYMLYVGKPSNIHECVKKYNALKSQQFMDVSTPEELKDIVVDIIDSDLRKWVESGGAYSFMKTQKTTRQEDLIQKTLFTQLENALLRRGFKDVDIVREPQLLDNKRVDFRLVSYGFTGPILIELKLSKHQDLNGTGLRKKRSYESFCQYMKGYNAHFGIFLVFDNKARTKRSQTWKQHLSRIKRAYKTIENVVVLDLKC